MNRITCIVMVVCLFLLSPQSSVFADKCDDIVADARESVSAAKAAAKQKEFDEAAELYEEAEGYYQQVSEMTDCECPKIAGTSRKNVEISRKNAERMMENAENQEFQDTYNQGTMAMKEGHTHAKNKDWEQAVSAFEEAEELMDSIASEETDVGKKAIKAAKKARKWADKAQEHMEE